MDGGYTDRHVDVAEGDLEKTGRNAKGEAADVGDVGFVGIERSEALDRLKASRVALQRSAKLHNASKRTRSVKDQS